VVSWGDFIGQIQVIFGSRDRQWYSIAVAANHGIALIRRYTVTIYYDHAIEVQIHADYPGKYHRYPIHGNNQRGEAISNHCKC
jgi:hypothetical protein